MVPLRDSVEGKSQMQEIVPWLYYIYQGGDFSGISGTPGNEELHSPVVEISNTDNSLKGSMRRIFSVKSYQKALHLRITTRYHTNPLIKV